MYNHILFEIPSRGTVVIPEFLSIIPCTGLVVNAIVCACVDLLLSLVGLVVQCVLLAFIPAYNQTISWTFGGSALFPRIYLVVRCSWLRLTLFIGLPFHVQSIMSVVFSRNCSLRIRHMLAGLASSQVGIRHSAVSRYFEHWD